MNEDEVLVIAVWFISIRGLGLGLVVRWQRFSQVVSGGDAVGPRLLLLLRFRPEQEAPLEAEVEQLTGGKGQRLFC